MSVVVPINECVSLIFENSQNIPEGFYIKIMDLLKIYYEEGTNLNEIDNFLNENKNQITHEFMKKIKNCLYQYLPKKNNCNCDCKCECNGDCELTCSKISICLLVFCLIVFPAGVIFNLFYKK